MTSANSKTNDEAQILELIDNRAKAIREKDVNGSVANYAPDVLTFDVVNALQYIGADAVRKRAEGWFSSFQGPIGYEIRDLRIAAGDTVAFCHNLYRVSGTLKDGRRVDMWVRSTVCFRKISGTWMVTHEHGSVPFDVKSGRASLDLKP